MIHASVYGFGFGFVVGRTGDAFGECFAKVERGKKILELDFLLTKNWVPLSPSSETFLDKILGSINSEVSEVANTGTEVEIANTGTEL
jgi:hypothetical protein